MIGIFWVIKGKLFSFCQSFEEVMKRENARIDLTNIIDCSLSHFEVWEKELAKQYPNADFATYPRGRVVFDIATNKYFLYVDECITNAEITEIVKRFQLEKYEIAYDEHYTCDGCIDEKELF